MVYDVERILSGRGLSGENPWNGAGNGGPLEILDELIEGDGAGKSDGTDKSGKEPFYNTYPFGTPTDKLFSRFLCVCRGNKRLRPVMDRIADQSRKIARAFPGSDRNEKTVILLTDKWDYEIFKDYESIFLDYAVNHGIWYIFVLVTPYGYTQIPFLPNDRNALRQYDNCSILGNMPVQGILRCIDESPFTYDTTGGTWKLYERSSMRFDVARRMWEMDSATEPFKHGKIPQRELNVFAKSIEWLTDEHIPTPQPDNYALDAPTATLNVLGRKIDVGLAMSYSSDNDKMGNLKSALQKLVSACIANAQEDGNA